MNTNIYIFFIGLYLNSCSLNAANHVMHPGPDNNINNNEIYDDIIMRCLGVALLTEEGLADNEEILYSNKDLEITKELEKISLPVDSQWYLTKYKNSLKKAEKYVNQAINNNLAELYCNFAETCFMKTDLNNKEVQKDKIYISLGNDRGKDSILHNSNKCSRSNSTSNKGKKSEKIESQTCLSREKCTKKYLTPKELCSSNYREEIPTVKKIKNHSIVSYSSSYASQKSSNEKIDKLRDRPKKSTKVKKPLAFTRNKNDSSSEEDSLKLSISKVKKRLLYSSSSEKSKEIDICEKSLEKRNNKTVKDLIFYNPNYYYDKKRRSAEKEINAQQEHFNKATLPTPSFEDLLTRSYNKSINSLLLQGSERKDYKTKHIKPSLPNELAYKKKGINKTNIDPKNIPQGKALREEAYNNNKTAKIILNCVWR